jgi:CheY-like chemotaxis protein
MTMTSVLPFQHPTTAALVDDDPGFLQSFSLSQRRAAPLRTFSEPRSLLAAQSAQEPLAATLYQPDQLPHLSDSTRFDLITVLVTDFEMGPMDGVELCRRVENRAIGRILLTGKVDERFAVRAFNEDVIDRYLRKDDPQLVELTRRYVAELKLDYFRHLLGSPDDPRYRARAEFLSDPAFAAFFDGSTRDNGIVEHHLCFGIPGFVMLDGEGELLVLLVMTESRLAQHIETAESLKAPRELVELLRSGLALPCFPGTGGFYSPVYASTWKNWTVTGRILEGRKRYYHATVSGAAAQAITAGIGILSCHQYLTAPRTSPKGLSAP